MAGDRVAEGTSVESLRTCFEDGLDDLAPLSPSVGDDGDDVALPHLQTGQREAAASGLDLLLDRLITITISVNLTESLS